VKTNVGEVGRGERQTPEEGGGQLSKYVVAPVMRGNDPSGATHGSWIATGVLPMMQVANSSSVSEMHFEMYGVCHVFADAAGSACGAEALGQHVQQLGGLLSQLSRSSRPRLLKSGVCIDSTPSRAGQMPSVAGVSCR
jgi:hypothetical protein